MRPSLHKCWPAWLRGRTTPGAGSIWAYPPWEAWIRSGSTSTAAPLLWATPLGPPAQESFFTWRMPCANAACDAAWLLFALVVDREAPCSWKRRTTIHPARWPRRKSMTRACRASKWGATTYERHGNAHTAKFPAQPRLSRLGVVGNRLSRCLREPAFHWCIGRAHDGVGPPRDSPTCRPNHSLRQSFRLYCRGRHR